MLHLHVWSPYLLTLMNRIESVQRRSARFIFNDYGRTSSVTCMLEKLNLPLLSDRRICNRMITMFKILSGIIHAPIASILLRLIHHKLEDIANYKLHQLPSNTNIYAQSFFPHSIKLWNSLPSSIVNCNDLEQFKSLVYLTIIVLYT